MSVHLPRRVLGTIAGVVAFMAIAPAALAHVTVSSPDATPGGFGKLVFRVPSESDTASTVKLTVTLPTDTPFASVSTKPMPGWSVATTEHELDKPIKSEGFTLTRAVATVTWTAERGKGVGPGQFDEFELSVGPFPSDVRALRMPAVQTYDDGTVVTWDESASAGGAEPDHPAPVLRLGGAAASQSPVANAGNEKSTTKDDSLARILAGAGVVLGLAGVGLGLRRHST